jgi:hypothetical protein
MSPITQFKEIRRDGKVIVESMTLEDVVALGATEKVVEAQWQSGGQTVSIKDSHGLLAKVVAGHAYVAVNAHDAAGQHRVLSILNADGSVRWHVPNMQSVRGQAEVGEFRWFEAPRQAAAQLLGVVFHCTVDSAMFQLDIDADSGQVTGVFAMR